MASNAFLNHLTEANGEERGRGRRNIKRMNLMCFVVFACGQRTIQPVSERQRQPELSAKARGIRAESSHVHSVL